MSLCIPTWQAQPFIARTLDFALGQTYAQTDILVSVGAFHPAFAEVRTPGELAVLGAELEVWALQRHASLLAVEAASPTP